MPYKDPEKRRQNAREGRARRKAEGRKEKRPSKEAQREYYHKNREKILAQRRENDAKDIEKKREKRREWAHANPEKVAGQRKRHRAKHGDEMNRKVSEYMAALRPGADMTNGEYLRRRNYARHREARIAASKEYAKNNKEKVNAGCRRRYRDNPEPFKRSREKYAAANREKLREKGRKHYYANRERYEAYNKEWRRKNPERQKEIRRRCYWKNPQKANAATMAYMRRNKDHVNEKAKQLQRDGKRLEAIVAKPQTGDEVTNNICKGVSAWVDADSVILWVGERGKMTRSVINRKEFADLIALYRANFGVAFWKSKRPCETLGYGKNVRRKRGMGSVWRWRITALRANFSLRKVEDRVCVMFATDADNEIDISLTRAAFERIIDLCNPRTMKPKEKR